METFSNMKGICCNLPAFGDQLNAWSTVSYQGIGVGSYCLLVAHSWVGQLSKFWGVSVAFMAYLPGPIKQTLGEASCILLTAERPLSTNPSRDVFTLYIHAGPVYSTFSPRFWFCSWMIFFPHKLPCCYPLTMINKDLDLNHFFFLVK